MRPRNAASLAASPVLIGVITVLVMVVGIFVAYNASQGLPFVPTYQIKANIKDASGLAKNAEVRVAGIRVGFISNVEEIRHSDGTYTARLTLKLDKSVDPVYRDASFAPRLGSTLGLMYLALRQGSPAAGRVPDGGMLPLAHDSEPVSVQDFFNTFNARTRIALRASLTGWSEALAGRGTDINQILAELRPLVTNVQSPLELLANPDTNLEGFIAALSDTATSLATAAPEFGQLFVNLDTTFSALAAVAPQLADTIAEAPSFEEVSTAELRRSQPFLKDLTQFATAFKPDAELIRQGVPDLASGVDAGAKYLPDAPEFNARVLTTVKALDEFVDDPNVTLVVDKGTEAFTAFNPFLSFVTPAQSTCNYATLLLRNTASLLSDGNQYGRWPRAAAILPPVGTNGIGFPSSGAANGPSVDNYLHANPYPNTAAPGQNPKECEAGQEPYLDGTQSIGNPAGDQGAKTEGK